MIALRGSLILCRYPETEDTVPGSPIILLDGSKTAITSQQGVVEAVGPGHYDEDGYFVPMDPRLKPGAWITHTAFARKPCWDDALFHAPGDRKSTPLNSSH